LIEEQERAGVTGWDPSALGLLQSYTWPGNVRELRNVVHRAYVMTEGKIIRPDVVRSLLAKETPLAKAKRPDRAAPSSPRRRSTSKTLKPAAAGRKK
jgi:DNA-binding NtrC family response regulator